MSETRFFYEIPKEPEFLLTRIPDSVGFFVWPGSVEGSEVHLYLSAKPSWLHRTMMRLLLGFVWRDA